MANQNFKVKKGLEVGTALTATSDGLNVTGVVTATQFSGDGSGLTGITAAGSGVVVQEEGSNVGTAATINFIGSNVTAAISGGVASVTVTGGSSDIVSDTTPQLGGNLDLNSKNITGTGSIAITGGLNATGVSTFQDSVTFQSHASFGDNDNAIFGAGQDLKIYHDGSHSRIVDSGTGSLISQASRFSVHSADDSETMIDAVENSQVKLYFNGNEKFSTTNAGVTITGDIQLSSHLDMPDSAEIRLGTGDDLKIYNNGTHSYIDNVTNGALIIRNTFDDVDVVIESDDGSGGLANYFRADGSAGDAILYHYGTQKFATKSFGVDITGELQCDSLDVDGNADISGTLSLFSNLDMQDGDRVRLGDGDDLEIYHDGNNSFIDDSGTGSLVIRSNDTNIQKYTGETCAQFTADGSAALFHDNSKKFETTTTGATVTGTLAATAVTGDGSGLTSLTGASAGTYGASTNTPIITVDSNGRITGIATVATSGAGGGGGISNIVEDTTPQLGGDLDLNGNDITGTGNITITSADAGSSAGPEFKLHRNSASPADADYLGQIKFAGESDTGVERNYAKITGKISDASNGTEDGIIEIAHIKAGSQNISARWKSTELQFLNGTNVSWADNLKATFGASDDLQIYHDGSNSYVSDAGTGGLKITGSDIYIRNTSDQDMIHASSGSFVKLYHNNALRLQTNQTGVSITDDLNVAGVSTFQSHVHLGDSDQLRFGAGNDLQIYHDGSNSYVQDDGTGALRIQGSQIQIKGSDTNNIALFKTGADVELYYNNSKKFETTNTGVTVTGALTATTIVKSGGSSSQYLMADGSVSTTVGISTNSSNIQATWSVTANGSSAYRFTGPGNDAADDNPDLYLVKGQRYRFINNSGGSHPFQIRASVGGSAYSAGVTNNGASSGNIEWNVQHDAPARLYYQCTAHSGMVGNIYITGGGQWQNTSVAASGTPEIYTDYNVGVGTANPGERLHLTTTSGNCKLRIDAASAASVDFYNSGTRFSDMFTDASTGNFTITNRQNADIIFRTNGTNERLRVTSSGNVSIQNDSGRFTAGAGDDLQMYHDGSHSYIYNSTGELTIANTGSGNTLFIQPKVFENSIKAIANGAVELYYDNSKKLETTNDGITVDNNLDFSSSTGRIRWPEHSNAASRAWDLIGEQGAYGRMELKYGGADGATPDEVSWRAIANQGVELYYDNDMHFATTSLGCKTNGDLSFRGDGDVEQILFDASDASLKFTDNKKAKFGNGDDLQIYHDGDNSFIKDTGTGRLTIATSQLQLTNAADSEVMIRATQDSAVELYHNGTKRFETQSTGFKLTGRFYLNGSSGAIDYNNTAHTLEYIVNGSAHSELNGGAYVPAGNKNLGSNAARWQTLYLSNGIDFAGNSNAAGMSSEVLDDYEEGSFTPSILRQTSNPSVSYSYQNGKYTKVGNMVLVYFDLNITSISGGSGRYEIHGLPFSSSTDTASGGYGSPQFRNSTAFGSVTAQENPSSYHSGTTINLRYHSNASTESDISVTTGRITGWSMYFTNS